MYVGQPKSPFKRTLTATLSRRAWLTLFAATLAATAAHAQSGGWQNYRRADLGFEIELPGAPKIEEEDAADKDDEVLKSVSASVDFDDTLFGIDCREYRKPTSLEEEIAAQRVAAPTLGAKIISETTFALNGFPGAEIVTSDTRGAGFSVLRIVLAGNRRFLASAIGARDKDAPTVRRFLGSFKLLPATR